MERTQDDAGTRVHEEDRPGVPIRRRSPTSVAGAIGALWGLAGYAILWEGVPVEVSRPFVESLVGTLALLPSRLVIWGILAAERLMGRTFDLSQSYTWIAPGAAATGAAIVISIAMAITTARRARNARVAARQPL